MSTVSSFHADATAVVSASRSPTAESGAASTERPCQHNAWDDLRTRKGVKVLICRVCMRKWKIAVRGGGLADRCVSFRNRGCCELGHHCPKLHIYRTKAAEGALEMPASPPQMRTDGSPVLQAVPVAQPVMQSPGSPWVPVPLAIPCSVPEVTSAGQSATPAPVREYSTPSDSQGSPGGCTSGTALLFMQGVSTGRARIDCPAVASAAALATTVAAAVSPGSACAVTISADGEYLEEVGTDDKVIAMTEGELDRHLQACGFA